MSNLLKSKFFLGALVVVALLASVSSANAAITSTLKFGSKGAQVTELQVALGVSPATGYFGNLTKAAVMAFQSAHGLTPDGVFGPKSLAAWSGSPSSSTGALCPNGMTLASNCMTAPSSSSGPLCPNGMTLASNCTSNGSSSSSMSGGETSITGISVNDADDDSINEGSSKTNVAEVEFDVDDADAQLVRVDAVFQAENSTDEEKPWRAFDKVYLMSGSTVLASVDAGDDNNWEETDDIISGGTQQAYRVRFANINKIFDEGSNNNSVWIAVDVASSVDGSDSGDADWQVGVDDDGLRFTDSAGVDTFESTSETANFSIEQSGASSGFNVTKDSSSPDANTLEVKENNSTTETIAIFKAKADADGGDVKINDFPVTLTIANTGTGDDMGEVVDDVMVVIDGTTYSTDDTPSTTLATQTFAFSDIDDDDVVIDAGDDVKVTVKVKFRSQGTAGANYANGTTILASAAVTDSDVEDADSGDDVGDVDGDADADTMTLAGNGISVDVTSAETDVTEIDGTFNDVATFTFKFDVTAFGDDDVYINKDFADVVLSSTSGDVDTIYIIDYSGGAVLSSQSGTVATNSSADLVTADSSAYGGGYSGEVFYKIASGDTESFTVTVTGTNQTDNKQVRAHLTDLEFTTDNITAATSEDGSTASIQSYTANLSDDSETPFESVQ